MKKRLISVLIASMGVLALAGCGKDTEPESGSGRSHRTEKEEEEEEPESDPETPEKPETPEEPASVEAEADNNGGNFIGIDGKVYFRQYGDYALAGSRWIHGFLDAADTAYGSMICCFDPEDPDTLITVAEDEGHGALYYYDGYLYSTRWDWENGSVVSYMYRTDLATGEREDIGRGEIVTASRDGSILLAREYDPDEGKMIYTAYDADDDLAAYSYEDTVQDGWEELIAADNDSLYMIREESGCDAMILQYDFRTGDVYDLSMIPAPDELDSEFAEITYIRPTDGYVEDDVLYFNCCYCTEIMAYVDFAYAVEVPVCTDRGEVFDGQVSVAEYRVNEEPVGTFADELKYGAVMEAQEVENTRENGFARGVQTADNVYGVDYFVIANCYYSPMWSQAQLGTYELLSLDYYYSENGSSPVLFNEENPTDIYLTVQAWFVGERGKEPEALLFRHADIGGPEGPFDTDAVFYAAEFSDELVFEHIPEGGDIYDEFETDGMEYLTEYLSEGPYDPYVSALTPDEMTTYAEPGYPSTYSWLHIRLDREGRIDYLRYVIFD